jgi:hypothetical protein
VGWRIEKRFIKKNPPLAMTCKITGLVKLVRSSEQGVLTSEVTKRVHGEAAMTADWFWVTVGGMRLHRR